jgi:hypothetical protein
MPSMLNPSSGPPASPIDAPPEPVAPPEPAAEPPPPEVPKEPEPPPVPAVEPPPVLDGAPPVPAADPAAPPLAGKPPPEVAPPPAPVLPPSPGSGPAGPDSPEQPPMAAAANTSDDSAQALAWKERKCDSDRPSSFRFGVIRSCRPRANSRTLRMEIIAVSLTVSVPGSTADPILGAHRLGDRVRPFLSMRASDMQRLPMNALREARCRQLCETWNNVLERW